MPAVVPGTGGSPRPVCVLCAGRLGNWDNQLYRWGEFTYRYLRCGACASLVCHPMPGGALIARLYGAAYATSFPDPYRIDTPRSTGWVEDHLASRSPGTFVDFGCGEGSLLLMAADAGWTVVGVEPDPTVAARVSEATGCTVLCDDHVSGVRPAEVVHVGDVLEHLPDPADGLARALALLAPHGTLLVQGPLEAGPSLFSSVVRPGRRRRAPAVETPPYHLIQATAAGQRALFRRCGLIEHSYDVFEVDWPAPSVLRGRDLIRPRSVALFALRRVSQRVDRRSTPASGPGRGNRFQYAGSRDSGGGEHRAEP